MHFPTRALPSLCIATAASAFSFAGGPHAIQQSSNSTKLSCPKDNGASFTASSGRSWRVECGIDHIGSDMPNVSPKLSYSLDDCITGCDAIPGCVDVSWSPGSPGPCYLKNYLSIASDNQSLWGAVRETSTCAGIDGAKIVMSEDTNYVVECDKDRMGSEMDNSPVWTPDLQSCVDACESNPGCIDISYVPSSPNNGPCYMKSSIEPQVNNTKVVGARRHSVCPDYDGQELITACGAKYRVECYTAHFGGMQKGLTSKDFIDCMAACDNSTGCIELDFTRGSPREGGSCSLRYATGEVSHNMDVSGARKTSDCTKSM